MVDVESAPLEQITKQLYKLINVVKISELDPRDSVERELMLVTLRADMTARSQVIELVNLFEGRVVDVGHDELTVSLDGEPDRLDDVEGLLRPFGIVELQRTGRVALPKLERTPPTCAPCAGRPLDRADFLPSGTCPTTAFDAYRCGRRAESVPTYRAPPSTPRPPTPTTSA